MDAIVSLWSAFERANFKMACRLAQALKSLEGTEAKLRETEGELERLRAERDLLKSRLAELALERCSDRGLSR